MDGWLSITDLIGHLPGDAEGPALLVLLAFALWGVGYAVALVSTRPVLARPGPATQDLPGDEPPAVVSVLANAWSVTPDAAESTLLDLAARGYVELRMPDADPRHTTIHVTAEDAGAAAAAAARQARVIRIAGGELPLTDYERQVLDHVRGVAVGGVVPLTALTFRDPRRAEEWSTTFARAVMADVRGRGLVQQRVPPWLANLVNLAALAPSLAVAWLARALAHGDLRATAAGLVPLALLWGAAGGRSGIRATAAGRAAASRWLGVREYLRVDQAFAALPPSAVAVWDRYLAYGQALGVNHVCSTAIDLGLGDRRRVWSSFGGHWHQVQVRYPGPGSRYAATATGLVITGGLQLAAAYGLLLLDDSFVQRLARRPPTDPRTAGHAVVNVIAVVAALLAARGLYRAVRGVIDVATARTISGEVLWVAPWRGRGGRDRTSTTKRYLAVDDGSAPTTTAWALPASGDRGVGPRDLVELRVRPWTRRVAALTVVESRQPASSASSGSLGSLGSLVAGRDPAVGLGPPPPLPVEELSARLGVPLESAPVMTMPGVWMWRATDGRGAPVVLSVGEGRLHRLAFAPFRRGTPVAGHGEEAYVTEEGAAVRVGPVSARLIVADGLPFRPDVALALLSEVLAYQRQPLHPR